MPKSSPPTPTRIISLLPMEAGPMAWTYMSGVCLFSLYNTVDSTENGFDALLNRSKQILSANPWLMGRLVVNKKTKKNEIHMYDKDPREKDGMVDPMDPDNYVTVINETETTSKYFDQPMNAVMKELDEFAIPVPKEAFANDGGIYARFYFIRSANKDQLITFFTISHCIADGYTMYALYNMLDISRPVTEMNPTRVDFSDYIKNNTGLCDDKGNDSLMAFFNFRFMKAMFGKACKRRLKEKYNLNIFAHLLNKDEVVKIKKEFNNGVDFVSTNDILTHWLGKFNPKCDEIIIACNMRNRVKGCDDSMAGCYIQAFYAMREQIDSPLSIRKGLEKCLNEKGCQVQRTAKEYKKYLGGTCTNWTSFYKSIKIPGHKLVYTMPTFKLGDEMMGFGLRFPQEEVLIIWQYDDDNVGLMSMCGNGTQTKEIADASPMTGTPIFDLKFDTHGKVI